MVDYCDGRKASVGAKRIVVVQCPPQRSLREMIVSRRKVRRLYYMPVNLVMARRFIDQVPDAPYADESPKRAKETRIQPSADEYYQLEPHETDKSLLTEQADIL